jgi:hypothetical protein
LTAPDLITVPFRVNSIPLCFTRNLPIDGNVSTQINNERAKQ